MKVELTKDELRWIIRSLKTKRTELDSLAAEKSSLGNDLYEGIFRNGANEVDRIRKMLEEVEKNAHD